MDPELELIRIRNRIHEMTFRLDEIISDLASFSLNLGRIQGSLEKIQAELAEGDADE